MLAPMAQPDRETLLKQCVDTAVQEGAGLVRRAMAEAMRSLAQASVAAGSGADRARFADASEALRRNSEALAERFPKALREEIGSAAQGTRAGAKGFSFDSLELMAEDQVDDTIELVRGQQAVLAAVEPDLVQFNAMVSGLQGHDQVQAASNPLRPELWVKSLHRTLGKGGAPAAVRALWMQHLCPAFGPQLAALYRRLTQDLMLQGVAGAAYGVSAPQHEARRRAEAAQFSLHDLKKLLVKASEHEGDTQGITRPAGETLNGMTLPAAMEALKGMPRMDDVVRRMQERWRSGVWRAERATEPMELGSTEYTPTQTLAREVVHQMVENIASDERLLPDVHHLVRQLEPPLLHLVQHDQRFFTDRRHPARELLEEITQRSLAWSRQNIGGFAEFMAPLQETVEMLSDIAVRDAEPFDYALAALRQSWVEAEERARKQRALAARALIKADARNHAATAISARLRERPDLASASPEVRRFLLGPWSQVMAAAQLASGDGAKDPGGYEGLINDIVWSSQPRLAAQNTARLQRIAAPLLEQVKEGLKSIGATRADIEPILATLAEAHAKALRGEAGAMAAPVRAAAPEPADWHADALPWLTPEEAQDSQIMQTDGFSSTVREQSQVGRTQARELTVGQYVEVMVRGSWARWKLAWASVHGTMLMFTDAVGRPQSITVPALAQMIDAGQAIVLPPGSVVDSALDAVAQAALEHSSQRRRP